MNMGDLYATSLCMKNYIHHQLDILVPGTMYTFHSFTILVKVSVKPGVECPVQQPGSFWAHAGVAASS